MGSEEKITLSVIKADVGGWVGHSTSHPEMLALAAECIKEEVAKGFLVDGQVLHVGDDVELIMTHRFGEEDEKVHKFAWDTFLKLTDLAKRLKLYGAGQDLLADTFSGNVKGMGPGVAEITFVERPSDPVIIFMADKTSPGAFNMPLFRMFEDPFCTAGLVIDPAMHRGFRFRVLDVMEHKEWMLSCPEDMYDLLVLIGATGRYVIANIYRKKDGEVAAAASVQRLGLIAGRYVGKDDPVMIIRSQSGFPAVGEVVEPFAFPHLVEGWMRGSHNGPLMPVSFKDARPTRFDGPPRIIAAGYQVAHGKLIGPVDLFEDISFDEARKQANCIANYMRRHGPFEPHRLGLHEMEYTTLPQVMAFIFEKSAIPRRSDLEDQLKERPPPPGAEGGGAGHAGHGFRPEDRGPGGRVLPGGDHPQGGQYRSLRRQDHLSPDQLPGGGAPHRAQSLSPDHDPHSHHAGTHRQCPGGDDEHQISGRQGLHPPLHAGELKGGI